MQDEKLLFCSLISEEAFITKIFVQMLPVDAVWRERILLTLGGCCVAQCCVVSEAFTSLLAISSLHPNLGWRKPDFLNYHHNQCCFLKYSFQRAVIISRFSSTIASASFNSAGFSPLLSRRAISGCTWKRASAHPFTTCT